jgi:hypothetical protein
VPTGESGWEFGTEKNPGAKADADYEKRSDNPGPIVRDSATFVFVTPREWSSAELWAKEKAAGGGWADVRAIDVVGLEDWLNSCPAVAARFAREMSLMPKTGVRITDQFWNEYARRFNPVLTEDVLLADRQQQADKILNQMTTTSAVQIWQADSTEEVIAFSVAAIRKADAQVRSFIEDRTLIIDNEDAARQLEQKAGMIFLLRADAIRLAPVLAQHNLVIVPVGRDNPTRQNATLLEQPTTEAFASAIKTMGLSEVDARRHAWNSGRSVTILARQIARVPAEQPEWARDKQLIPALMAGSWSSLSEHDRLSMATLAGVQDYYEYEGQLLQYLRMQDSPILKEGDVWQVRAPVDAFAYLSHLVGVKEFERLRTVATTVFSETDPSLDLPEKEQPYASIYGKKLKHSAWLRDGLAKTLRLIAVRYEPLGLTNTVIRPDQFVDKLVLELPGLAIDYHRMASLHGELPILMEAAPRPLLSALERMLEGDGKVIVPIFQDKDPLFSHSPHTGLLWALEALAWDPQYLSDATLMLAGLARVDPDGKLMNRPIHSLREIFLAWHPSTNATLGERIAALDVLIAREPSVGWDLIVKLLPGYHDVASPTAKPRYRDGGSSEREVLTRGLVARSYDHIIDRAFSLAGEEPRRWVAVVKNVSVFSPAQRSRAIQLLEAVVNRFSAEQCGVIWSALRDLVAHHRAFPSAEWAMRETDIAPLEGLANRLVPSDPVARVAWLFNDYHPRIPAEETPKFDLVDKTREQVIRDLLQVAGTPGVLRLAETVSHPEFVAVAVGSVVTTVADLAGLAEQAVNRTSNLATFASVLSGQAEQRLGLAWHSQITLWRSQRSWTDSQFADLLLNWRDTPQTWEFAAGLGREVDQSYWRRKTPWPPQKRDGGEHGGEYEMAAQKYLSVGRAIAAIQALQFVVEMVSTATIFEMLDVAVGELNASAVQPTSEFVYDIDRIFDALRQRGDVPAVEIARREYAYLPLFDYHGKQLTIHQVMSDDPHFYVDLICHAFKPRSGDARDPTPENQARAKAAYRLLSEFRIVPGVHEGEIDEAKLRRWVEEVHRLAKNEDRAAIGDEFIGHVLAYAPSDPDGAWPHQVVRRIVDELASKEMELGIQIERVNMRGVHSRALYGGGEPEREIAEQMRQWARLTRPWPRTTAMLERLAKSWEDDAEREDARARQDKMRFES